MLDKTLKKQQQKKKQGKGANTNASYSIKV